MRLIPQAQLAHRYRELARTLKNQGQSALAKATWMHALDLLTEVASSYPDLPAAQKCRWDCANDIAWFLINEADCAVADPQLAVRLATLATQADPEAAVYWNTLGAAHLRAGNAADAITALERSVALTAGGTGFDYVFLALAHAQLGHPEQARQWKTQADLWMEQHEAHIQNYHVCMHRQASASPAKLTYQMLRHKAIIGFDFWINSSPYWSVFELARERHNVRLY